MKAYLLRQRRQGILFWESPYRVLETAKKLLDNNMGYCPKVEVFASKIEARKSAIGNVLFEYEEEYEQWFLRVGDHMIDMNFMVKQ